MSDLADGIERLGSVLSGEKGMAEVACPSCGHAQNIVARAYIPDSTRLAIRLTPTHGERLTARSISASLEGIDKVNRMIGKDLGYLCVTLVDRVEMNDGEIIFHLIVTNVERPVR